MKQEAISIIFDLEIVVHNIPPFLELKECIANIYLYDNIFFQCI
ncbi:hypothetical protein [Borreliella garinii]|nr:hypothetical protein [Borreliella garinii]